MHRVCSRDNQHFSLTFNCVLCEANWPVAAAAAAEWEHNKCQVQVAHTHTLAHSWTPNRQPVALECLNSTICCSRRTRSAAAAGAAAAAESILWLVCRFVGQGCSIRSRSLCICVERRVNSKAGQARRASERAVLSCQQAFMYEFGQIRHLTLGINT